MQVYGIGTLDEAMLHPTTSTAGKELINKIFQTITLIICVVVVTDVLLTI